MFLKIVFSIVIIFLLTIIIIKFTANTEKFETDPIEPIGPKQYRATDRNNPGRCNLIHNFDKFTKKDSASGAFPDRSGSKCNQNILHPAYFQDNFYFNDGGTFAGSADVPEDYSPPQDGSDPSHDITYCKGGFATNTDGTLSCNDPETLTTKIRTMRDELNNKIDENKRELDEQAGQLTILHTNDTNHSTNLDNMNTTIDNDIKGDSIPGLVSSLQQINTNQTEHTNSVNTAINRFNHILRNPRLSDCSTCFLNKVNIETNPTGSQHTVGQKLKMRFGDCNSFALFQNKEGGKCVNPGSTTNLPRSCCEFIEGTKTVKLIINEKILACNNNTNPQLVLRNINNNVRNSSWIIKNIPTNNSTINQSYIICRDLWLQDRPRPSYLTKSSDGTGVILSPKLNNSNLQRWNISYNNNTNQSDTSLDLSSLLNTLSTDSRISINPILIGKGNRKLTVRNNRVLLPPSPPVVNTSAQGQQEQQEQQSPEYVINPRQISWIAVTVPAGY